MSGDPVPTLIEQGALGALVVLLAVAIFILWRASEKRTDTYIETLRQSEADRARAYSQSIEQQRTLVEIAQKHEDRAHERHEALLKSISEHDRARAVAEHQTGAVLDRLVESSQHLYELVLRGRPEAR